MPYSKFPQVTFIGRQIENSKRNGWRHLIFSPGRKYYKSHYRGQWENDKKEGRGTETQRNGSMYEGEWVNNQRHGYGILKKFSEDGCLRECYVGNWVRGKKHGFGCNLYGDGSYYEGAFYQNKRQRYGCMWYANGSYYEGIWKNDHFDGAGTFIQANGNRYEGEFVEGKKEGRGTFHHLNTGQVQYGFWKNDFCVNASMRDSYRRQSALRPTPYPIPKFELLYTSNDFTCVSEICGNDQSTVKG